MRFAARHHARVPVFELGRDLGIDVRNEVLRDDDLFDADEAFLTSTTREACCRLSTVDDRTIGTGKPGPIAWKLLRAFSRARRGAVTRVFRFTNCQRGAVHSSA